MTRLLLIGLGLGLACVLPGLLTAGTPTPPAPPALPKLEQRVAALETAVATLQGQVAALEKQMAPLKPAAPGSEPHEGK